MENLHYPPKLRRRFGPGRSGEPVCRYALCETENWLGLVNGLQQVCAWRLLPALKECAVRGRLASFHRTPSFPQQEGGAGDVTVRGVSSSPMTERHTFTGWFTTRVFFSRVFRRTVKRPFLGRAEAELEVVCLPVPVLRVPPVFSFCLGDGDWAAERRFWS